MKTAQHIMAHEVNVPQEAGFPSTNWTYPSRWKVTGVLQIRNPLNFESMFVSMNNRLHVNFGIRAFRILLRQMNMTLCWSTNITSFWRSTQREPCSLGCFRDWLCELYQMFAILRSCMLFYVHEWYNLFNINHRLHKMDCVCCMLAILMVLHVSLHLTVSHEMIL